MSRFLVAIGVFSSIALSAATTAETKSATPSSKPAMGDQVFINVDPKARMQDLLQAFNLLRKEKGAPKVFILLKNGEKIQQIIDITPMDSHTLALIRYSTPQGIQLKVLGVEDIDGIMSSL